MRRCERGILRLRSKVDWEFTVWRMDIECRQRPRVLQDNARSVSEVEHGASEARELVFARANYPVPIQPEVRMDDAAVPETNQLMLATSLHARDARALQRAQRIRRYPSPQRWMENLDALDDCICNGNAKLTNGSLDLWKFRHASLAPRAHVLLTLVDQ